MQVRSIKTLLICLLSLTLLLLTACGNTDKGSTSSTKTMSVGLVNAPTSFNPINTGDIAGQFIERFMFDSFLDMTHPLKFEPKLAESIDTTDNQTYKIKLNPKAKWSDGKPITADDVVFTFNLIANPKSEIAVGAYLSALEGMDNSGKLKKGETAIPDLKKVDEHTVSFKTKVPVDPNYIKEMIGTKIITLPAHVLQKIKPEDLANSTYMQAPNVTSGPYTFVKYVKNTYVQFKASKNYYLGKPKVSSMILKIMQAPNLVDELKTGGIQMTASGGNGNISFQDLKTVQQFSNVKTQLNKQIGYQTMMFNTKTIKDAKVRQAIATAINREQIVKQLLKGYGDIVDGPYTKINPYLNTKMKTIGYDPAKAKQMLKDAGFDFNKTINLVVPIGNKVREQSADIITQNLKAVGIKVNETTYDFPTVMQKGKAGDFDLLLIGLGFTIDPDISSVYAPGGAYNFMSYNDPESTKLLEQGKLEPDSSKRHAIYNQLQEIWDRDMPIFTLYSSDDTVAVGKDVAYGGPASFWPGTAHNLQKWSYKSTK
ncbi:ABC transporter substrate-binding protein [Sporolactobacillus laevolacticus]|nr:ABC transporter substrate-binding protein [Sporolactobacillus laevolacticus]